MADLSGGAGIQNTTGDSVMGRGVAPAETSTLSSRARFLIGGLLCQCGNGLFSSVRVVVTDFVLDLYTEFRNLTNGLTCRAGVDLSVR